MEQQNIHDDGILVPFKVTFISPHTNNKITMSKKVMDNFIKNDYPNIDETFSIRYGLLSFTIQGGNNFSQWLRNMNFNGFSETWKK